MVIVFMPGPKDVTECIKLGRRDRDEFREIAVVLLNINPPLYFHKSPNDDSGRTRGTTKRNCSHIFSDDYG